MYFIPIIDDDNWNTRKILVGLKIQLTSKTMPHKRLDWPIAFLFTLLIFFLFIYYAFLIIRHRRSDDQHFDDLASRILFHSFIKLRDFGLNRFVGLSLKIVEN